MARHHDLEVIEPDSPGWAEAADRPRSPAMRRRIGRPRRRGTAPAFAVVVALATVGAGAAAVLAARSRHRPPAVAASSSCGAVSSSAVARLLQSPAVMATAETGGVCRWTTPDPARTALVIIQVYDAPLEARTAFQNQQAQSPVAQPWRFGDAAFTEAQGVHASAVALVGTVTVIADANGLSAPGAAIAAAQSIVELTAARLRGGWLPPRSSSLPLP